MKPIIAALALLSTVAVSEVYADLTRSVVPGEVIVCFVSEDAGVAPLNVAANWQLSAVSNDFALDGARPILNWKARGNGRFTHVVSFRFPDKYSVDAVRNQLESQDGVQWTAPNYSYAGDPREFFPNDPQQGSQYHHGKMKSYQAWDITLGSPNILIAITDDGFSIAHSDLAPNVWINPGEIAGDGIDNDANGYIDDVNGWDFIQNNNNVNPNNASDAHGTHVCGIAAARTNNSIGVAGTAGQATFLPIQFYDSTQAWTSTHVALAFNYAVNSGARIITMSYNLDNLASDPTAKAAFQYAYDNDVLYFNSAGNNGAANPPRQSVHQALLVASTTSTDAKASTSNYGTGIDIAAPGQSIFSTLPNNTYGTNSGTSMASPNAAGVAALIWSAHPTWTRDQVAARLFATADNIDAANPSYIGLLGGGRANAFAAVDSSPLPPPRIRTVTGLPVDGAVGAPTATVTLRFNQILSPAAVNDAGAFALVYAGADSLLGTPDDELMPMTWSNYLIGSNEVIFTISQAGWVSGEYQFVADAAVLVNPFGTALDGNADGTGGDSWASTFFYCGGASRSNCGSCAADMDGNVYHDARDIPAFVDCAVNGSPASPAGCGCADLDGNGAINETDAALMVDLILNGRLGACCRTNGTCMVASIASCEAVGGAFDASRPDCIGAVCPQPCPCPSPIVVFPYINNFEGQATCSTTCGTLCSIAGGWTNLNDSTDTMDWTADVGGTPSSGTGPTVDSNPGTSGGIYLYTEASSCTNRQADLVSPCFNITSLSMPVFSLDYHMYGSAMGRLEVAVTTDQCIHWTTVATLVGQQQATQGAAWQTLDVDLSAFVNDPAIRIRIRGATGGDYTSDIAIDNARLTGN